MSNIIPFGGGNGALANPSALAAALQNVSRETMPSGTFLRMGKDGEWIAGPDLEPVADGAEFAINPTGFGHGDIAWGMNSNRLGESFVPLTDPVPTPVPLTEASEQGWQSQLGMHLRELASQTDMLFRSSSVGGKRAVGALAKEVGGRLAAGDPKCVAIITLGTDSYKHGQYGKIYVPEFIIERWVTVDSITAAAPATIAKEAIKKAAKAPVNGRGKPVSKGKPARR